MSVGKNFLIQRYHLLDWDSTRGAEEVTYIWFFFGQYPHSMVITDQVSYVARKTAGWWVPSL